VAVVAPVTDPQGALIDAQIAVYQALVTANRNPRVEYQLTQELNKWQVEAVDHYMVNGWLNAATILLTYSPPAWDVQGQKITARIAQLTTLYNNAVTTGMPVGNAFGYGSSGWTTIASAYAQQLYAKQIEQVEHIMGLPGGTSAATILANMTGFQTAPAGITFEYVFSSVGFTDEWIDD
jgi:hypothetical protein